MNQTAANSKDAIDQLTGLSTVTINMLIDFLSESTILYRPPVLPRRSFQWFSVVSHVEAACSAPTYVPDPLLLFVCTESEAASFLSENPSVFALVLASGESCPPHLPEQFADRIIVISQESRFSYFVFQLQSYFTKILIWENDLDRIVARQGTLAEMFDASAAVLKNFTFVSDNYLNVIAYTRHIEPPDEMHRQIIRDGYLTSEIIGEKRQRLPEKTYYVKSPSGSMKYSRLSMPLFIEHTYFASLSMCCHAAPLTEGLKDLFSIFAKRFTPLCEKLWRNEVTLNIPHYFFFSKLLDGEPLSSEYVDTQLRLLGIDQNTEFKLITLQVDSMVEPTKSARAVKAASSLNQRNVFCFPYRKSLLALCHAPASDSLLSHTKTLREISEKIYEPLGIVCGISEIFTSITDLDLAFKQTEIALGLKRTIDSEQFASDEGDTSGSYLFSNALMYYLIDPSEKDERFMRFCFSHSILEKIYREDKENGTNSLSVFWFYLYYGRNATAVSQRLHMHRNTVLYHIDKIQKRFDFDLSQRVARDRLMLEFKHFFLTLSQESLEALFPKNDDLS